MPKQLEKQRSWLPQSGRPKVNVDIEEFIEWSYDPTSEQGRLSTDQKHRNSHNSPGKKQRQSATTSLQQSNSNTDADGKRTSNTVPVEWYTFRIQSALVGFDLEMWWKRSVFYTRLNVVFLAFLFSIGIIQFVVGIAFISSSSSKDLKSPYICNTLECQKASAWIAQSMNKSTNPCENFYEFVCGAHKESNNEPEIFAEILHAPELKIEFGKDSFLAQVLKQYSQDPKHNQPILYYQACLNERKRKRFGLTAFKENILNILGTSDLASFESSASPSDMAKVGERVLNVMGHAVYLVFGFYPYPHIYAMRPVWWMDYLNMSNPDDIFFVETIVDKILTTIDPTITLPQIKQDMVNGIGVMTNVRQLIHTKFYKYQIVDETSFKTKVLSDLSGLCPPMGIQMDIHEIFHLFTGENLDKYIAYYNYIAEIYWRALRICFNEDPSKFNLPPGITNKKSAFVSSWIFGVFIEFVKYMDVELLESWGISDGNKYFLAKEIKVLTSRNLEYLCMVSMWRTLGFIPSMRKLKWFGKGDENKPENIELRLLEKTGNIVEAYDQVRQFWDRLPDTVNPYMKQLGKALLYRGFSATVMVSRKGGEPDDAADDLGFTADHLRNSFLAMRFTIRKAKTAWSSSTNSKNHIRWWGRWRHDSPYDLREELLSHESPMFIGATFVPEKGAARNDRWIEILGSKPFNYVLYPLTLFSEPFVNEALSLEHASTSIKIYRTFLSFISEALSQYNGKYEPGMPGSLPQIYEILDYSPNQTQSLQSCKWLDTEDPNMSYRFFTNGSDVFSFDFFDDFLTSVALKITWDNYIRVKKDLRTHKYAWLMPARQRKYRIHHTLPNSLKEYSDDQLFFIMFARQMCRERWSSPGINLPDRRYRLETSILNTLLHNKAFSDVWKCKRGSFMNLGADRCISAQLII